MIMQGSSVDAVVRMGETEAELAVLTFLSIEPLGDVPFSRSYAFELAVVNLGVALRPTADSQTRIKDRHVSCQRSTPFSSTHLHNRKYTGFTTTLTLKMSTASSNQSPSTSVLSAGIDVAADVFSSVARLVSNTFHRFVTDRSLPEDTQDVMLSCDTSSPTPLTRLERLSVPD
jgi:hypothetical protein